MARTMIFGARPILFAFVLLAAPFPALAQNFPALTGRVVDEAHILKPEDQAALEAKLKAHEDKTSDQVVVATIPSLGDLTIEDYANRLLRQWQLGQKGKSNGVLLLVAPQDRKIRIEVGYGLEGALTDALSKVIISTAIAPQFQKGDFGAGINTGVDAILSVLTGDAEQWQRRAEVREDDSSGTDWVYVGIMAAFFLFILVRGILKEIRRPGGPGSSSSQQPWVMPAGGSSWNSSSNNSFSSGSGSSGGGFSGGGGSSGGGGASGSW